MLEKRDFYINGTWITPAAAETCEVINPSTESPCAVISLGTQADTDAAVAAAKAALPGWMATPVAERIALVENLLAAYRRRKDEIAKAMSLEMGAPMDLAHKSQAGSGSYHLTNFIKAAKEFEFERPLNAQSPKDRIVYEAVGVAALITPWNCLSQGGSSSHCRMHHGAQTL